MELTAIVYISKECIYCGRKFKSVRSCKSHMRAANHCKLHDIDDDLLKPPKKDFNEQEINVELEDKIKDDDDKLYGFPACMECCGDFLTGLIGMICILVIAYYLIEGFIVILIIFMVPICLLMVHDNGTRHFYQYNNNADHIVNHDIFSRPSPAIHVQNIDYSTALPVNRKIYRNDKHCSKYKSRKAMKRW